jgi:hypothetical protein
MIWDKLEIGDGYIDVRSNDYEEVTDVFDSC